MGVSWITLLGDLKTLTELSLHRHAYLLICLLLSALALGQECQPSQERITVQASPAIIKGAAGSARLHVTNMGTDAVSLNLGVGAFISNVTQGVVSGTKVDFVPSTGTSELPKNLPAGASTDLLANISSESEPLLATARIFNAGTCIGLVRAVRYEVPLAFIAEGDGTGSSLLQVQQGREIVVGLKNTDDLTYPISVSLSLDGKETTPQPMIVGPNSSTLLRFSPPQEWFQSGSWFRPLTSKLQIIVRLAHPAWIADASIPDRVLPSHSIPLAAQLTRFPQWVAYLVVLSVLLMGGLASLAVNSLLPNILKKLAYKRKLQVLADGTSAVSMRVDSRLRVVLRVERNRLAQLLAAVGPLATDTGDTFRQIDVGIDALNKRLTVAQRLDDLRNQFELRSQSCPPSLSDNIDETLQKAADQLRSLFLTDNNVDNAKASLDSAETLLNTLNDPTVVAKGIASRHKDLIARVATFRDGDFAEMKGVLPGLFSVLSQTYDDANPVLPSNFMEVDDSVARLNVVLDYTYIRATTKDPTIESRIEKKKSALIANLGARDWRTLRSARDLVQQMRENIYVDDLLGDLSGKKARITLDQQVARTHAPLEFCICFHRHEFNRAQALEELTCEWEFGDKLAERGWAVCHFFQEAGDKNVAARIPVALPDSADQAKSQQSNQMGASTVDFLKPVQVRSASNSFTRSKWVAEGLRFAIAFFLALVGLIAGAQDQLAKLDVIPALIAVFLLGFGADTIKNSLAQPQQAQQSPAKA